MAEPKLCAEAFAPQPSSPEIQAQIEEGLRYAALRAFQKFFYGI